MRKGVIYVLTNPSFPEYVKIGYADNLEKRLHQLNRSECLPFAFRAYCVYEVEDRLSDKKVHEMIDRINPELRSIETFDGKKRIREFYNITAEDAYEILHAIALISNTKSNLRKITPEGHEISDEKIAEEMQDSNVAKYSEEEHLVRTSSKVRELYEQFKRGIRKFGEVTVTAKKHYITFRSDIKICDVVLRKNRIIVFLNLTKGTFVDPKKIVRDVSKIGHYGIGNHEISVNDGTALDYAIDLIRQAHKWPL